MQDTIFALSTGFGISAVAVIRISGARCNEILEKLTRRPLERPRVLALRALVDSRGDLIDEAMVVRFSAPTSFTGQDCAELQCHGSRAVVARLLDELATFPGCRLAEPGEFTRRALENGKFDLSVVEGLGDLVSAETEFQRKQALRLMAGGVSTAAEAWRSVLLHCRTLIEVTIDWVDEEVPENVIPEVSQTLEILQDDLQRELSRSAGAERLRAGFEVALIGPPNVGKSSLLNAIAGRDAALVSDIAGTTRDVIEVRYDLNGIPVVFLDTAGLHDSDDTIERMGMERTAQRAGDAALRVSLRTTGVDQNAMVPMRDGDLTVWTKGDLSEGPADVVVSAKTGVGLDQFLDLVFQRLKDDVEGMGLLGHVRQQNAVRSASEAIARCLTVLDTGDLDIAAELLREASTALERLVGRIDVEDVLGSVFSSFCLGK